MAGSAVTSIVTSIEPSRSSAYANDLRWQIVWQCEALAHKPSQVAENLHVDEATVRRVLRTFRATGTVDKRPYLAERAFRVITEPVKLYIAQLVLERPGILLREIVSELVLMGIDVSESAVCKVLHKSGFTTVVQEIFM